VATTQIRIIAEVQQATKALNSVTDQLKSFENSVKGAEQATNNLGGSSDLAAKAVTALTAALSVRQVVNYTNTWTDLNSRLRNATGSQQEAEKALKAISETARKTYQPVQQVADVFLQNNLVLTDLGYTTNEQIKLNTLLNNTLAVSGSRGEKAASAVAAFGKAVGEGKISTETLNSMLKNNTRFVEAMAASLGISVEQLRKMASEGKLETGPMLDKLAGQMQKIQQEADAMPAHIGDAMTTINNALLEFIGKLDQSVGASQKIAEALIYLADNIDDVVVSAGVFLGVMAVGKLMAITRGILAMAKAIRTVGVAAAFASGGITAVTGGLAALATFAALQIFDNEEVKNSEDIADNAEDIAAKKERALKAQQQLTKEQQKALEALGDTAIKLGQNVQFLQDSLNLGQEEAEIRRLIAQETEKLKKVNLEMTPQQEQMLRLLKEEEASIRRITALRKEQGQAAYDALRPQTTVGQEYEKVLQLRRQFEQNMTKEERDALNQQEALRMQTEIKQRTGMDAVLYNQVQTAKMAVANEVAKYNKMTALDVNYQKSREEIDDIIHYHQKGLFDIGQKNYETVLATRAQLDQSYAMQKMQLESEMFANFSAFEDMKIQRAAETHAEQLRMQNDFLGNQMFSNETIKQIAADRAAFEKKTDLERVQFGLDQGATMFAALGAQNKKAFEASKALAVASAVMNTYQGATKALATYPWPFGLIAAAAAVAAGFAQVNAIKSQQYSGKMVGGAVAGAGSYLVGEKGPELFTPGVTGNITPNHQMGGGSTNVNFTIVANDTAGFDELLTSRRGVIQQIISDAMLERGQRM
jgi:tape measure domain-containing protein